MLATVDYMIFYPDNYQGGGGEHVKHSHSFQMDKDKTLNENLETIFSKLYEFVDEVTYHTHETRFIPICVRLGGFEIAKFSK